MKNFTSLNQSTLRFVYVRIKKYLLSFFIIIGSVVVFLNVVLPQISQIIDEKSQVNLLRQKIATLKNNMKFISSLDDSKVTSQYKLVSMALPSEKDFVGIINAITSAAVSSEVALGDFNFSVGQLSEQLVKTNESPQFSIALSVTTDLNGATRFVNKLTESLPLSSVSSIASNDKAYSVNIDFYYKPLPIKAVDANAPLYPLPKNSISTFNTLATWSQNLPVSVHNAQSSSSATTQNQSANSQNTSSKTATPSAVKQ